MQDLSERNAISSVMDSLCKRCGSALSSKKDQEEKPVVVNIEGLSDKAKDAETSPPETPQSNSAIGPDCPTAVQKEKPIFELLCEMCSMVGDCMIIQITKRLNEQEEKPEVVNKEDLQDETKPDETTPSGPSQNETANKPSKKESVDTRPKDTPPTQRAFSPSIKSTPSEGPPTTSGDADSIDSVADDESKESSTSRKSSSVDDTEESCDPQSCDKE